MAFVVVKDNQQHSRFINYIFILSSQVKTVTNNFIKF